MSKHRRTYDHLPEQSPDDYARQQMKLKHLQTRNTQQLDLLHILSDALGNLSQHERQLVAITEASPVVYNIQRSKRGSLDGAETEFGICFVPAHTEVSGDIAPRPIYAPVGYARGNNIEPYTHPAAEESLYDLEEVMVVHGMSEVLRLERDFGNLPHLKDNLMSIIDLTR